MLLLLPLLFCSCVCIPDPKYYLVESAKPKGRYSKSVDYNMGGDYLDDNESSDVPTEGVQDGSGHDYFNAKVLQNLPAALGGLINIDGAMPAFQKVLEVTADPNTKYVLKQAKEATSGSEVNIVVNQFKEVFSDPETVKLIKKVVAILISSESSTLLSKGLETVKSKQFKAMLNSAIKALTSPEAIHFKKELLKQGDSLINILLQLIPVILPKSVQDPAKAVLGQFTKNKKSVKDGNNDAANNGDADNNAAANNNVDAKNNAAAKNNDADNNNEIGKDSNN